MDKCLLSSWCSVSKPFSVSRIKITRVFWSEELIMDIWKHDLDCWKQLRVKKKALWGQINEILVGKGCNKIHVFTIQLKWSWNYTQWYLLFHLAMFWLMWVTHKHKNRLLTQNVCCCQVQSEVKDAKYFQFSFERKCLSNVSKY